MCTSTSFSASCCSLNSHSLSLLLLSSAWADCCLCREASSCRCFSRLRCFSCSIRELGREDGRDKDVQEDERSLRTCRWSSMKLSCWTTTAWDRQKQKHSSDTSLLVLCVIWPCLQDILLSVCLAMFTLHHRVSHFRFFPFWFQTRSDVLSFTKLHHFNSDLEHMDVLYGSHLTCRVLSRRCRLETLFRTCCWKRETTEHLITSKHTWLYWTNYF